MSNDSKWTLFWDMHSGGGLKEDKQFIYIEAPKDEAKVIFYNLFGHNPDRVSCTCCGEDYSVDEGTLDQLSAYHRGCKFQTVEGELGGGHYIEEPDDRYDWKKYISLEDYLSGDDIQVIYARDIKDSERVGDVPEEGYVWV